MNLKTFFKTHDGALSENLFHRIVVLGLIAALVLVSIKAFSRDAIVTLQPYTLKGDAWITQNSASQSYKEAWGLLLAQLSGNVTPGTVDFVKERFDPLLAPSIYTGVMEALEVQAEQIRNDRVSMRFEPRSIEYEPTTDKVFVYGYSYIEGPSSEPDRGDRTYEYIVDIRDYAPVVTHLETYSGRPRTERIRQQMQRQEESRRERENG
ncbi:conjugal transfer pilus assembly protein TraE [Modicisalibacter xianhensis]|uniref:Conjugal transfer pilus assembly protein TraE n=1 Tax=Modicisalibacter xianhensis TaxID=442341 RepID=A0A4R8FKR1_9GAMM|nr:TraE/TraK family type IV conjugative transfer system protein [Halomonas xianhensis]TDX26809.1 conjugal transfer pilus assembly protein TraE [Halomonas xianhensis]